ncbi:MAG: hypothetical protein ACI8RZ_004059 [Myxococcota bacterium]
MLPYGQSFWSTATTATTCRWTLDAFQLSSLRVKWDGVQTAFYPGTPTRSSFSIEPGCRLSGSSFLPEELIGAYSGAGTLESMARVPWYNASLSTTFARTSTNYAPWKPGNYMTRRRKLYRTGSAAGGTPLLTYP